MAECNISIDQEKLPGVKEVCRDFAVLEDHCLAYNLQEQEIESHLASNVHKSRLVQNDLQVAKKLQEEEDKRAKIHILKQNSDIERQDNEIAHGIQEELARQAEQQRQQEEEDAAIARKLQEKEMKEERRRQKTSEMNMEEEYFEDRGAARRPLDLDKHVHHGSTSPAPYDTYTSANSNRDYSPDYSSSEPKRNRHPRQEPASPQSRSRYPEHHSGAEGGRSRHADPYPEQLLPSRGKHGDRWIDYEPTDTGRNRAHGGEDRERDVRRKERPDRPPAPHWHRDRDMRQERDRARDIEKERHMAKEQRRYRDRGLEIRPGRVGGREGERSRDRVHSMERQIDGDWQRQKDKERRPRTRSRDRVLDEDFSERHLIRDWPTEGRAPRRDEDDFDEKERSEGVRHRVQSVPEDVFAEPTNDERMGDNRGWSDPQQGEGRSRERVYTHPTSETGRLMHRGTGAVVPETEYELNEATKGLTKLDLREQEFKDMEVARKLQEEEMKASNIHVRAVQVAQDEEIARLLMEQEKREYKRNREREKEKEREKERERERERERMAIERMAMDRRRQEGDYRPNSEDVVRPRTREELEYQRQKNQNKPSRSQQPRVHNYENVNPGYGYPDHPAPQRPSSRPEAALRGAYYKR